MNARVPAGWEADPSRAPQGVQRHTDLLRGKVNILPLKKKEEKGKKKMCQSFLACVLGQMIGSECGLGGMAPRLCRLSGARVGLLPRAPLSPGWPTAGGAPASSRNLPGPFLSSVKWRLLSKAHPGATGPRCRTARWEGTSSTWNPRGRFWERPRFLAPAPERLARRVRERAWAGSPLSDPQVWGWEAGPALSFSLRSPLVKPGFVFWELCPDKSCR